MGCGFKRFVPALVIVFEAVVGCWRRNLRSCRREGISRTAAGTESQQTAKEDDVLRQLSNNVVSLPMTDLNVCR
jgi:hypothetical protein